MIWYSGPLTITHVTGFFSVVQGIYKKSFDTAIGTFGQVEFKKQFKIAVFFLW